MVRKTRSSGGAARRLRRLADPGFCCAAPVGSGGIPPFPFLLPPFPCRSGGIGRLPLARRTVASTQSDSGDADGQRAEPPRFDYRDDGTRRRNRDQADVADHSPVEVDGQLLRSDELTCRGIVVAGAVVIEIGFGVEVAAGEGEAGFCRGGGRGPNSAESVVRHVADDDRQTRYRIPLSEVPYRAQGSPWGQIRWEEVDASAPTCSSASGWTMQSRGGSGSPVGWLRVRDVVVGKCQGDVLAKVHVCFGAGEPPGRPHPRRSASRSAAQGHRRCSQ